MMRQAEYDQYLRQLESSEEALTADDLTLLYEIASSKDSFDRSRVASILVADNSEKTISTLLQLTYDQNRLARTEAVDSICVAKTTEAFDRVASLAQHDPEWLVRGYAVMSLLDIAVNMGGDTIEVKKKIANQLVEYMSKETDAWVLGRYYCTLYFCGEKMYLQQILDSLKDEDGDVRARTVQDFFDILTPENETIIAETAAYYLPIEEDVGIQNRLKELISYINDYEWEESDNK